MHHSVFATRSPRTSLVSLTCLLAVVLGCSGTGTGCSTLTPFAAGTRYSGPKSSHGVSIRISASGFNYLNSKWQTLVEAFAPGGKLHLPVGCTTTNVTVVGDIAIADQGAANCNAESCGRMDGNCDAKDIPADVVATITGFSITPMASDSINASLSLEIDTGNIYVDTPDRSHGSCVYLSPLKCAINFNTSRHDSDPNAPVGNTASDPNRIKATVTFGIDSRFDQLLSFSVGTLSGTQICGASGAPNSPECLEASDLKFDGQNNCGDAYCGLINIDFVKNFVLGLLSGPLQTQVKAAIGGQTCWACQSNADCPVSTDGSNTQSTCDTASKTCKAGATCVPRFLGVEGIANLGGLLGSFGAPADAALQLSVAAGAYRNVDTGLSLSTRVGIQPGAVSSCVPPQAAPAVAEVAFPDFEAEARPGSPFHVGLGLSAGFLNTAFWGAQQAGALCLNLTTENVGLINTGLFKTFLPSLGKLTTRDGKDAPMMVVLRPGRAPTITIGEGTYDPITKKPIKPLLLITLADVSVDFYAFFDDREARLFTLTADISLPLSLIFEGCDKVTPAIGDLKMLIANIRTGNAEILAEDPQVLADLVPAVIGLAEPALAGALSGFALPTLGNFKLKVNEAKGLGKITGSEAYNHLGIYAQLLGANDMCAASAPRVSAGLKSMHMPAAEEMRLQGHALPVPEVVLSVGSSGMPGSPEYAFQIDQGLWSDFRPANGNELVVSSNRFLMQGAHEIHVRTRNAEETHAVSAPTTVSVVIDWAAPDVSLTVDREHDRVLVQANDVVSGARLEFAYATGEGAPSSFGAAREISLSSVETLGAVTVLVRDEAGNVGQASLKFATTAERPEVATPVTDAALPAGGCSSVAGFELIALAALGLLRRRR